MQACLFVAYGVTGIKHMNVNVVVNSVLNVSHKRGVFGRPL
jgi:hypothetical protein